MDGETHEYSTGLPVTGSVPLNTLNLHYTVGVVVVIGLWRFNLVQILFFHLYFIQYNFHTLKQRKIEF